MQTGLGGTVLDTHRLRRDFHRELGPWGSDEHHYKLQLINVYHTHMKENGGGSEVQQSKLSSASENILSFIQKFKQLCDAELIVTVE